MLGDSSIHSKSDSQNHDLPPYRVFLLGSFCTLTLNPSSDIIAGRAVCRYSILNIPLLHRHSVRERKKLHETFSSFNCTKCKNPWAPPLRACLSIIRIERDEDSKRRLLICYICVRLFVTQYDAPNKSINNNNNTEKWKSGCFDLCTNCI
jgi:hypothetical protein